MTIPDQTELELTDRILIFFRQNARNLPWRENPNPYRVWVSEIMLQQTRVEAVVERYRQFMEVFPDVEHLAAASEEVLLKLWEGLGYYSRARNLHRAAKQIVELGEFPRTVAEIRQLPGVGEYTAGAIASIAFHQPEPAVDGNVLRVLSRLLGHQVEKKEAARWLAKYFPPEGDTCSAFTQGWMELGATVCLPNGKPRCNQCPLGDLCCARAENRIEMLPAKKQAKRRPVVEKTVFLVICDESIALCRRPGKGVLANMWGFPEVDTALQNVTEASNWLTRQAIQVESCHALPDSCHIFTHLEWRMKNYLVRVGNFLPDWVAATRQEILHEYALPSAYRGITAVLFADETNASN